MISTKIVADRIKFYFVGGSTWYDDEIPKLPEDSSDSSPAKKQDGPPEHEKTEESPVEMSVFD
jgi:hypothetical protein